MLGDPRFGAGYLFPVPRYYTSKYSISENHPKSFPKTSFDTPTKASKQPQPSRLFFEGQLLIGFMKHMLGPSSGEDQRL